MEHQILDQEFIEVKRKPWQSNKTGIRVGIAGLVLFCVTNLVGEITEIGISHLAMLTVFLVLLVAQILTAMYGSRKKHYLQIVKVGAIATTITLLPTMIITLAKDSLPESDVAFHFGNLLGIDIGFVILGLFFGFIFWLVPGKLAYFKNKIEEE